MIPTPAHLCQASRLLDLDPDPDYQDLQPSPDRYLELVCSSGYRVDQSQPEVLIGAASKRAMEAVRLIISHNSRSPSDRRYKITIEALVAVCGCSRNTAYRVIKHYRRELDHHHTALDIKRASRGSTLPPIEQVVKMEVKRG